MLTLVVTAALMALQTPMPPVGQRTANPQTLIGAGMGPDASAEDADVAAANAFPLGSRENPVRVGGPDGERDYLASLRCADGNLPRIGVRAEDGIGAFGSVVSRYSLDCGAAAPGRTTILLDMYHEEHREARAPAGFSIQGR